MIDYDLVFPNRYTTTISKRGITMTDETVAATTPQPQPKPKPLTLSELRALGACSEARQAFEKHFGIGSITAVAPHYAAQEYRRQRVHTGVPIAEVIAHLAAKDEWVIWLALARHKDFRDMAAGMAIRYAAKVETELAPWVDIFTEANRREAQVVARAIIVRYERTTGVAGWNYHMLCCIFALLKYSATDITNGLPLTIEYAVRARGKSQSRAFAARRAAMKRLHRLAVARLLRG